MPSFCNILCSFLDTSAPGLSQQSQAVHLLLLPSTSCLMPALCSHLHGHPSSFPSTPPYRVLSKSSLLHRQAGHQGTTCWINSHHCLLGIGYQRTFLREHPLDHLLLPGRSSSPCPSPFTQPRCFTSSPHYLSSPYLTSLFYFFTKLFVLFSSDLWPGNQAALVYKPFGPSEQKQEHCPACIDPSTHGLLAEWEAGLSIAGHTLCACQHPAPLQCKYTSINRCTDILPCCKSFT